MAGAKVQINAADVSFGKNDIASRYRPLRIDKPVGLSIDGKALGESITLMPDKFYTIVIGRDGENWKSFAIDEGQGSVNDLKAQLRFFNLMRNCEASLRIEAGTTIFNAAEFGSIKSRAVNPVQAQLEAFCNGRSAAKRSLPPLRNALAVTSAMSRIAPVKAGSSIAA